VNDLVLVMTLLERARKRRVSNAALERKASRLFVLSAIVGDSRAFDAALLSFVRDLAAVGVSP